MPKFIKTSDRLPDIQNLSSNCNKYYIVKLAKSYRLTNAMLCKNKKGKIAWYANYTSKIIIPVLEWLDESEEEITDKQRLDWLQKNVVSHHYQNLILECDLKNYILLREFIDNQIKQE